MNEIISVTTLARSCHDFSEHVDKIIEQVNLGDIVAAGSDIRLDSTYVMMALIEEDGDTVNRLLSSLSIHTPLSREFAQLIDDKTEELAEEAAHSYEGKYDE